MTVLVNPSTDLINEFLNRYEIWHDHHRYYDPSKPVVVQRDPSGIPFIYFNEVEVINNCPADIIGIDCTLEGWHSAKYFRQYRKDKKYIIVTDGLWNKETTDLEFEYEIVWYPYFLYEYADNYFSPGRFPFYYDKHYDFSTSKPYMFMLLTGVSRPERELLIRQLQQDLTYDNYILKFGGNDLGVDSSPYEPEKIEPGKFNSYDMLYEKYFHFMSRSFPIKMFNQCNFNVVVETDIVNDGPSEEFFVTEKTAKALVAGIPFVIVSTSGYLKNLRQLGFTTYSNLWDESYDDETDYRERIKKISALCERLKDFDWQGHKEELENIANKNIRNFTNFNRYADISFKQLEEALLKWSA